jgi:simple sugar transport system permease protein
MNNGAGDNENGTTSREKNGAKTTSAAGGNKDGAGTAGGSSGGIPKAKDEHGGAGGGGIRTDRRGNGGGGGNSGRHDLGGWRTGHPSADLGGRRGPSGTARADTAETVPNLRSPDVPPRISLYAAAGMVLILIISLALVVILAFLFSKNPGRTLRFFFLGPLQNPYQFGNMLNGAVPLLFGGLGVSIAMKANNFNLGGEGQVYAGAFVTTIAAVALGNMGWPGAVLALLAGAAFSGGAAWISGLCRARWNTSELITSFLISGSLVLIVNYFVTGPFMDRETNLLSTEKIPVSFRLPRILPPSNLSAGLYLALGAVFLVSVFLSRTRLGYEIRMTGSNELFARYGGIETGRIAMLAMFLSGAFYGLAGGLSVYGTYYATIKEFSSGMGWNSLAAAIIARFRPALLIPSAIFFAWIGAGARLAMQFSDVTLELASIVQGAILLLATSQVVLNLFKRRPR